MRCEAAKLEHDRRANFIAYEHDKLTPIPALPTDLTVNKAIEIGLRFIHVGLTGTLFTIPHSALIQTYGHIHQRDESFRRPDSFLMVLPSRCRTSKKKKNRGVASG